MAGDDDLVSRARAGEPAAWRELYEGLSGRLLVWLRTRPSEDPAASAEDVLAEAWLVAASKIADFTGTADDFGGWLFGIARNLNANAQRRARRRATVPDDAPEPLSETHEFAVSSDDWVRQQLARLPVREGEVLALLEVAGLDVAGASAALGISRTAVRVARHRGLARLRKDTTLDLG